MPLSWRHPYERIGVWAYRRMGVWTLDASARARKSRSQHRSKHAYAFLSDAGYCLKKEPQ
jgi:hypothetical protein